MNSTKAITKLAIFTMLFLCNPIEVNAQPLAMDIISEENNENRKSSEQINVGAINLKMEIYDNEFNIVNPLMTGFKCNSSIGKIIQEDSIILNVPINDVVDALNYTKFNYDINYRNINKILATNNSECKIDFNNVIVNRSNKVDKAIGSINNLEKEINAENINKKVNINSISCSFNDDYFIKITIDSIQNINNAIDDYSTVFSTVNLLEDEEHILNLDFAKFDKEELFNNGDFSLPIDEEYIININRDNIYENKYLDLECYNNSEIRSLDDNGIVEYYNNDLLIIKYDNFKAIYKDVILTNYNDTYYQGEIIGISKGNKLNLYLEKDGYYANTNYFYSYFNYSTINKTVPQYIQTDSLWGENHYGSSTIGASGCGPSAFSMALSAIKGIEYTTDMAVEDLYSVNGKWGWFYYPGKGSYYTIFKTLGDMYDINVDESISISKDNLIETLNEGKIVILSIKYGPVYQGKGHFIVLYGTEDEKFYISDSADLFEQDVLYDYKDLGRISKGFALY